MNLIRQTLLRLSLSSILGLGLVASASARPLVNRVVLNCNHEDTLSNFMEIAGVPDPVPLQMDLEVAGAGWSTLMWGPVVCISQNYSFTAGEGEASFKLRDAKGDVLVYKTVEIRTWTTPEGPHFAQFAGTYVVDTAKCTGRYAGATGEGCIEGWADNDASPLPAEFPNGEPCLKGSGQGWVEMIGTLVLKDHRCGRR